MNIAFDLTFTAEQVRVLVKYAIEHGYKRASAGRITAGEKAAMIVFAVQHQLSRMW